MKTIEKTQDYSSLTKYIASASAVSMSTLGGAFLGGLPGAVIGMTTSLFDEFLLSKDKVSKHYFTESAFFSGATLIPAASLLSSFLHGENSSLKGFYQATAAILGIATSYFTSDFLDYRNKLELPFTSLQCINQFFDANRTLSFEELEKLKEAFSESYQNGFKRLYQDAKTLYQNPFIYHSSANLGLEVLGTALNQLIQLQLVSYTGDLIFSSLLGDKTLSTEEMYSKAMAALGVFLMKDVLDYFIDKQKSANFREVYKALVKEFSAVLLQKENTQKILADEKARESLAQMPGDLFDLLFQGVYQLNPILISSVNAFSSLYLLGHLSSREASPLNGTAPMLHLAPYLFFMLPAQWALAQMAQEGSENEQKFRDAQDKNWNARFDLISNLSRIQLRDAAGFAQYKFCEGLSTESELITKRYHIRSKESSFKKIGDIINKAIDFGYLGSWVLLKKLDLKSFFLLKQSLSTLRGFFSSGLQFQFDNKELEIKKNRIQHFFDVLAKNQPETLLRTNNDQKKIIFKDYSLFLGEEKLIHIDHFEFEAGKRYAIMGKSGCGKSTLLTDLKMGLNGKLSSSGELSIGLNEEGKEFKTVFIDQNLYLPVDTPLLEVIYFPKILKDLNEKELQSLKSFALQLFDELAIDQLSSSEGESKESLSSKLMSSEFKLSGGQSKKIAVIQAILMNPDVLIMDETFTGLDANSLDKVQKTIQRYLPKALVLSIDHHAKENNQNLFYDTVVSFQKEGLEKEPCISSEVKL